MKSVQFPSALEIWVEHIADSAQNKRLAILCGAGISCNSGIPMVWEIEDAILKKLLRIEGTPSFFQKISSDFKERQKDLDHLLRSGMPFEYFMSALSMGTDFSPLLKMYGFGVPNTNHQLIAELSAANCAPLVVTTNFDLLLEKALDEKKVPYHLFLKESEFPLVSKPGKKLVKLHGGAQDTNSIRTIIEAVAAKRLSESRADVIRYLFSKEHHDIVLILGYSCSDNFDISPCIETLPPDRATVVLVDHTPGTDSVQAEDIKASKTQNPFSVYEGIRLRMKTDLFIKRLWESLSEKELIRAGYSYETSPNKQWRQYIDDWHTDAAPGADNLLGVLLYRISQYERAIFYHLEALKKDPSPYNEATASANLANIYLYLNRYELSERYSRRCIELEGQLPDKRIILHCYEGLGAIKQYQQQFEQAVSYFEKALELARRLNELQSEAGCYTGKGSAYNSLDRLQESLECHQKALALFTQLGCKLEEGMCYTNLGNTLASMDKYEEAIESYQKALAIIKTMKNSAEEGRVYLCLGMTYYNYELFLDESGTSRNKIENMKNSLTYFDMAEKIFKENRQEGLLGDIYYGNASICRFLGHPEEAKVYDDKIKKLKHSHRY